MAATQQSRSRSSAAKLAAACSARPAVVLVDDDVDEEHVGHGRHGGGGAQADEADQNKAELRRGPWTVDEDLTLVNYIADNGEGRWNSLARAAGLKQTGKSCRLRWLNYLRPDVKRGNFTADEQLLILDLHTRWGNRWSKIAQHLPGRTDNEIKNYWRTRVQKHAKQLNCDANSKRLKDAMRYLWMPHLVDIDLAAAAAAAAVDADADHHHLRLLHHQAHQHQQAAAGGGGAGNDLDSSYATTAADIHAHAAPLSGVTTMTSSSDSFASGSYEDGGGGGLFANVRAGDMLLDGGGGGGGDWAAGRHEANNQGLMMWPLSDHDQSAVQVQAAGGQQFQDPELSGWVQGFSESITDNFWALEGIWKMQ